MAQLHRARTQGTCSDGSGGIEVTHDISLKDRGGGIAVNYARTLLSYLARKIDVPRTRSE